MKYLSPLMQTVISHHQTTTTMSPSPPLLPRAPDTDLSQLNATALQALADAAHARWNLPSVWLFVAFLFVAFVFNMLKALFFPERNLLKLVPDRCFTWIAPRDETKRDSQESLWRWEDYRVSLQESAERVMRERGDMYGTMESTRGRWV
ncbi:hypothetical protein BU23DRAFT_316745 [Bimuria novae-zelandiae CBS 107.79]|uniref:Uncharacterized protein n=1 Tax=Bimuria novae-zelandiae CBS 107.79 TaxID=1447943 RepID=A0A6A5UPC6_9PLEO|nr:hypothetical protein BU23DRAFT_316745 [Bimuria novae-zelandiae CBS 107.79]